MLFSSVEFIFLFLPTVAAVYFGLAHLMGRRTALAWLIVSSLVFYGFWNPPYLALLVGSIAGNYFLGQTLARRASKPLLGLGVAFNLGLIAYFKYADFFIGNAGTLFGAELPAADIVLPLAISFFTFQQIAFLVDVYQGKVDDPDFLHYALFVSFFPQLIAGPIVHHSEVIPQFRSEKAFHPNWSGLWAGLAIFLVGLQKKIVLADGIAAYANSVFDGAAATAPTFFPAWIGALAYTFQLYFDFSGYTDMAIGLALIFGITLPLNFDSPYKAVNIIDFWRRWHMTLARFLRVYLYVPLGGNRKGQPRRYVNLMVTMLLGGLWHGASWTFVFWGGLHGAYLAINHAWHALRRRMGHDLSHSTAARSRHLPRADAARRDCRLGVLPCRRLAHRHQYSGRHVRAQRRDVAVGLRRIPGRVGALARKPGRGVPGIAVFPGGVCLVGDVAHRRAVFSQHPGMGGAGRRGSRLSARPHEGLGAPLRRRQRGGGASHRHRQGIGHQRLYLHGFLKELS